MVKLDNYQLDDIFRITKNDGKIFYVYPLIDELQCERIFATDPTPPIACGENRVRYMNYKPMRIEYTGGKEKIGEADRIIEGLTLTKSEGVTTENTRQSFPIEYWKGDGGYLELSAILPLKTLVSLSGSSAEASTQLTFQDSSLTFTLPHESEVLKYNNYIKFFRVDLNHEKTDYWWELEAQ